MSPRIAYWTSSFEPEMEAVASEVATLRHYFTSSVAWGLSHRHWILLSHKRGYCLNPRLQVVFRAAAALLEPAFDINHIFGSLGDWFYLRDTKRSPTILTVATANKPVNPELLKRVDKFVVEYPSGRDHLQSLGIRADKIRLIYPGVDQHRFYPAEAPQDRFTVLFVSSPDKKGWLEARGVPQILDAAERHPEMRFRLLWRPWGDTEGQVRQWIADRELKNVELLVRCSSNVAEEYRNSHVTVALFTDASRSKPVPNSLIESMASGRPVITTNVVGLADLIREEAAGIVCAPTGRALAESLESLQRDWGNYSACARSFAERFFNVYNFIEAYTELYTEVIRR
jgi:glycosyltransferase involved in cell wall biosynthesis